ncbi:MAG: DUF4214 domain-containing protein [Pseudomonadota bacterium]
MNQDAQLVVIDLGPLAPEAAPDARSAVAWAQAFAEAAGQEDSDLRTISIFASVDDEAFKTVLNTVDLILTVDPDTKLLIYEGWGGVQDQVWFAELIDALTTARPDADIALFPIGSMLEMVMENPLLANIDLTTDSDTLELLAGMIAYSETYEKVAPGDIELPETVDAVILENFAAVAELVLDVALFDPTALVGTEADDLLKLTPEILTVDGGLGTDSIQFDTLLADAKVTVTEGVGVAVDLAEQSITATDVERFIFEDGTLAFDEQGNAGQAYRLYQASFDRTPDAEGLGFWIGHLDAGALSLTDTASLFIGSKEFADTYGAPDDVADDDFLTLLYANVLRRTPDEEGFEFWRETQENGLTRDQMLVFFSESAENKALVSPAFDDGIWYV